jgi:hypothetical protein
VHLDAVGSRRDNRLQRVLVMLLLLGHGELHIDGQRKIKGLIVMVGLVGGSGQLRGDIVEVRLRLLALLLVGIVEGQIQIQVQERGKVRLGHLRHLRAQHSSRCCNQELRLMMGERSGIGGTQMELQDHIWVGRGLTCLG